MKLFHDFILFFCAPLFGLSVGEAGGGADAGQADGGQGNSGQGGSGAAGAAGAAGTSGAGSQSAGSAAGAGAGAAAIAGPVLGPDGKFMPGWAKTLGGTDALEAKFTDPKALVGSYLSLEKMIGLKGIIPPGPNATPEEKSAFFKALGRPDKPEEYGIKMPEKIGDKPFPKELWNEAQAGEFAKWAHEKGWSKQQVQDAIEFDAARSMRDQTGITASQQAAQQSAITALKAEWGANYPAQVKLAQDAAKQVGGEELMNHPLANDPVFIKAMAKVGAAIVETPAAGARGTQHSSVSVQAQIDAIMADPKHAYWTKDFNRRAEHEAAVKHVESLYKLKHGEAA